MGLSLTPGATFGSFLIEAVIAQGGQGLVLRARPGAGGPPVALKVLLDLSGVQRARLAREAETLSALAAHPRIPSLLGSGEVEGHPYLALELIEGDSLAQAVKERGAFSPEAAAPILLDLARTVEDCHQRGLLHRDLKPANVLVDAQRGAPFLLDFGVVRLESGEAERLSVSGQMLGTPSFMAPEQVENSASQGDLGPATDVYGLGAVLYFLLTAREPFEGPTALNVITKLVSLPPADPRSLNAAVPRPLAEFVLRCLAKAPSERPQSARAFGEELRALAVGAAPAASAAGGLAPKLLGAALASLVLCALGLGAAFALWPPGSSPPSSPEPSPDPDASALALPSPGSGPQASSSPAPSPALPKSPPETSSWEAALPGSQLTQLEACGPLLLVGTSPLAGEGRPLELSFYSLAGERLGAAPPAFGWVYTAEEGAFALLDPPGGGARSLIRAQPGTPPQVLAEVPGALALSVLPGGLCVTGQGGARWFGFSGDARARVVLEGRVEGAPLLLDLEGPARPQVLVATSASEAVLLSADGEVLARCLLPAPVGFAPALLRRDPQSAEVGLVSGSGNVIRLSVSVSMRALDVKSVGRLPAPPESGLIATRDPSAGTEPEAFLCLAGHSLLALDPSLEQVKRSTRFPAPVRGLLAVDLDGQGEREALVGVLGADSREHSWALCDAAGGVRSFLPAGNKAHPRAALLGPGRVALGAPERLRAWGPWSGLPTQPAEALGALQRGSRLGPAREVELSRGGAEQIRLEPGEELAPLSLKLTGYKPWAGRCGLGVNSLALACRRPDARAPARVPGGSRFVATFVLESPLRGVRLELETQVAQERGGAAFVEVLVKVGKEPPSRPYQLASGRGREEIPLGDLGQGSQRISIHVSSRSSQALKLTALRLLHD